jgi:DNA modification methylase
VRVPYLDDGDVRLYQGDVLDVLREMEAESVQTCVTSPPYWGLRDYGTATWEGGSADCDHVRKPPPTGSHDPGIRASTLGGGKQTTTAQSAAAFAYRETCGKCGATRKDAQLGLEPTPGEYVARMVEVFREVRRVLRDDGTLWLNLGDSYANGHAGSPSPASTLAGNGHSGGGPNALAVAEVTRSAPDLKPKDLVGIPWRVAFALQEDGWYLRADVIWAKPNPMPESVTDRPTKAHEYVFLLSKSPRYFYDAEAVREPSVGSSWHDLTGGGMDVPGQSPQVGRVSKKRSIRPGVDVGGGAGQCAGEMTYPAAGRNARSVWTITTKPYAGAHFATFPTELPTRCIKAGTPEAGRCAECGAPRERVVVATAPDGRRAEMRGGKAYDHEGRPLMGDNMIDHGARGSWNSGGRTLTRETSGFRPSCECDAETVPAVVLDPFSGAATTALVARGLGRRAVGIELNPEYLAISAERLRQLSLFGQVAS